MFVADLRPIVQTGDVRDRGWALDASWEVRSAALTFQSIQNPLNL
jgi:hypothetical protein